MNRLTHFLLIGLLAISTAGCELVVDFDRSLIVDDVGPDAIADGGADAAADAGADGAVDAMVDASVDGPADTGADGASDAGDAMVGDAGMMCDMPSECDDSVACTTDECTADFCVSTPVDSACDDSNPCTANSCDLTLDCQTATLCALTAGANPIDVTTAVTLQSVNGGAGGILAVVFEDDAGSPGVVIGSLELPAGAATDVDIDLDRQAVDGEVLYVRYFVDAGVLGTFEDGIDLPALDADGAEFSATFTTSIAAGTPDFEVTISGDGANYTFSGARSGLFTATGNDPALTLFRGHRYRIVNTATVGHPFEFIVGGVPDMVMLSQAVAGANEGDAGIDWLENGDDLFFTVDATFEAVVDRYRCSIHTATMRGNVNYADSPF